jgi:hypothetical protein
MNFYLNVENSLSRLWNEYKEHGSLVVAYDFDDTFHDYNKMG